MDRLDAVATHYVGLSITEFIYSGDHSPDKPFDQALCSGPALFMVQYALAQTLLAEGFAFPDTLLGASLGEFVAAVLGDVIDVETMLFDVIRLVRLFDAHCAGGAMLAVIDDVKIFQENRPSWEGCELAGEYFSRCFVVAGPKSRILQVAGSLREHNISCQLLPVSVAYHSSSMDSTANIFARMFAGRVYRPSKVPIISCSDISPVAARQSRPYTPAHWWQVIREPVQFSQAFAMFAGRNPDAIYLDAGPSGNMATFAKYILPSAQHDRIVTIMTQFGCNRADIETAHNRLDALAGAAKIRRLA